MAAKIEIPPSAEFSHPIGVRASVNETALLKRLGQLFSASSSVIGELMQNARRAGASEVRLSLDAEKNILVVSGCR